MVNVKTFLIFSEFSDPDCSYHNSWKLSTRLRRAIGLAMPNFGWWSAFLRGSLAALIGVSKTLGRWGPRILALIWTQRRSLLWNDIIVPICEANNMFYDNSSGPVSIIFTFIGFKFIANLTGSFWTSNSLCFQKVALWSTNIPGIVSMNSLFLFSDILETKPISLQRI